MRQQPQQVRRFPVFTRIELYSLYLMPESLPAKRVGFKTPHLPGGNPTDLQPPSVFVSFDECSYPRTRQLAWRVSFLL